MVPKQLPVASINSFLHTRDHRSRLQPKCSAAAAAAAASTLHHHRQQQAMLLHSIATVYSGSMGQAALLQKLFDAADGRILAEESLARIARRICSTWEPQQQSPSYLLAFVKFIKFVLSNTNQPGEPYTLGSAIRICHHRRSAFPTVHAPLVLLLALGYLERLSRRYLDTRGEPGCAQRLFLMAYSIAAKYLHANLAFISAPPRPLVGRNGPAVAAYSASKRSNSPHHSRSSSPFSPPQSPTASSPTTTATTATTAELEPVTGSLGGHDSFYNASANSPLTTMTASTNFLSRVIPNVTTRELYRMEIELLSFLDYDLAVYSLAEVQQWRDLFVPGPNINANHDGFPDIKQEAEDPDVAAYSVVKTEEEDEGIGHYEPEEGGHAEDALARGNLLM